MHLLMQHSHPCCITCSSLASTSSPRHLQSHHHGGPDSTHPRTRTTPPPPPKGASGQQLIAKGAGLRSPWAPKVPDAPRAPKAPEGNTYSLTYSLYTPTLSLNPTLTLTPTPPQGLVLVLPLPLIKTEYWDRVGGEVGKQEWVVDVNVSFKGTFHEMLSAVRVRYHLQTCALHKHIKFETWWLRVGL